MPPAPSLLPRGVHPTWYVANSYLKYPSYGITIPVDSSCNYVVYIGSLSHSKKKHRNVNPDVNFQLNPGSKKNKHLPFIESTMVQWEFQDPKMEVR